MSDLPSLESLRPRTLAEYGRSTTYTLCESYVTRRLAGERRPPILIHGAGGTGKTSLVRVLAAEQSLFLSESNASADTSSEKMWRLLNVAMSEESEDGNRLLFIDECDALGAKAEDVLLRIVKDARCPVILACNDVKNVSDAVRKACFEVGVPYPTRDALVTFARRIGVDPLPPEARTWRDVVACLTPGTVIGLGEDRSDADIVRDITAGGAGTVPVGAHRLAVAWVMDNAGDGARVDRAVARYRRAGRRMSKYVDNAVRGRAKDARWPWSLGGGKKKGKAEKPAKPALVAPVALPPPLPPAPKPVAPVAADPEDDL